MSNENEGVPTWNEDPLAPARGCMVACAIVLACAGLIVVAVIAMNLPKHKAKTEAPVATLSCTETNQGNGVVTGECDGHAYAEFTPSAEQIEGCRWLKRLADSGVAEADRLHRYAIGAGKTDAEAAALTEHCDGITLGG